MRLCASPPPGPGSRPLGVSVLMGAFISYTIALCATVNSPLAATVTGNVKDLAATFFGTLWLMRSRGPSGTRTTSLLCCAQAGRRLVGLTRPRRRSPVWPCPFPELRTFPCPN